MAKQCFQLATGLPGESLTTRVEISDSWKNLDPILRNKPNAASGRAGGGIPYVDPAKLAKITDAAFAKASEEEIPNDKLVAFMGRYPPVLWKDRDGAEKLLDQCERAAAQWKKAAIQADRFNGKIRLKFERFSNGLDLGESS